jgi:prophage antirepressor-like protein
MSRTITNHKAQLNGIDVRYFIDAKSDAWFRLSDVYKCIQHDSNTNYEHFKFIINSANAQTINVLEKKDDEKRVVFVSAVEVFHLMYHIYSGSARALEQWIIKTLLPEIYKSPEEKAEEAFDTLPLKAQFAEALKKACLTNAKFAHTIDVSASHLSMVINGYAESAEISKKVADFIAANRPGTASREAA